MGYFQLSFRNPKIWGGNFVVNRKVFEKINGWNEDFAGFNKVPERQITEFGLEIEIGAIAFDASEVAAIGGFKLQFCRQIPSPGGSKLNAECLLELVPAASYGQINAPSYSHKLSVKRAWRLASRKAGKLEDREISAGFIKAGLSHYAIKYNRFMGVISDFFLTEPQ